MNNSHKPAESKKEPQDRLIAAKNWIRHLIRTEEDDIAQDHVAANICHLEGKDYEELKRFLQELRRGKARTIE